jgi:hypothetical protein
MSLRSVVAVSLLTVACGKSGPPLPPLVKLPAAPANIVAERRGTAVDVQFTVPVANTDGTRPANVERVDVYAITGPESITDDQIFKHGLKVASVTVKAPRDPDQAAEPDDPDAIPEQPAGEGLDQGTLAHVGEQLTTDSLVAFDPSTDKSARKDNRKPEQADVARPLMGPRTVPASRTYVGVGISTRGKKGPLSKRVTVPLVPPPPVPGQPTIKYDEKAITVEWQPVAKGAPPAAPAGDDVLPSTPIGQYEPAIAYHVYDVALADAQPATADTKPIGALVRLTQTPVADAKFDDTRIAWGEKRCYAVRTIETIGGLTIESDASPAECKTLTDTFPPAAPANLQAVAAEGAISLIWDASPEKDLAGYLVLRAVGNGPLETMTDMPIPDPRFHDDVKAGLLFTYLVKAVDKAGNVSAASNKVEETAR